MRHSGKFYLQSPCFLPESRVDFYKVCVKSLTCDVLSVVWDISNVDECRVELAFTTRYTQCKCCVYESFLV